MIGLVGLEVLESNYSILKSYGMLYKVVEVDAFTTLTLPLPLVPKPGVPTATLNVSPELIDIGEL